MCFLRSEQPGGPRQNGGRRQAPHSGAQREPRLYDDNGFCAVEMSIRSLQDGKELLVGGETWGRADWNELGALAVDDRWARLVVLLLRDPHVFERAQGSEDGPA